MDCIRDLLHSQYSRVSELQRLREIVEKLRAPDGCPWDQEQTHDSLVRCLIEEVSETLEAIDKKDYQLMEEELGDLLLQVVFHALIAEEKSKFDLEDVARGINEKLIRRHPHVFGDEDDRMKTADEVLNRWEKIKAEEKRSRGISNHESKIFKNLPPQLPALLYAVDIYKQAEKANLLDQGDWSESKISDFASDLNEETAGRVFFEWVGACKKAGLDPESALRKFASPPANQLEND